MLEQAVDGKLSNKFLFSDEVHFTLAGYINKQIRCIYDSENPQVIEERPFHVEKVNT